MELEAPPTFWDAYTTGSEANVPTEIMGSDIVGEPPQAVPPARLQNGKGGESEAGTSSAALKNVYKNMAAGSALTLGGGAAATVTATMPDSGAPNYYPPTPPSFPPIPTMELQG